MTNSFLVSFLLFILYFFFYFFFFFQAEDGIRDWSVTGVQTCALPISGVNAGAAAVGVPRLPGAQAAVSAVPASSSRRIMERSLGGIRRGRAVALGPAEDSHHLGPLTCDA